MQQSIRNRSYYTSSWQRVIRIKRQEKICLSWQKHFNHLMCLGMFYLSNLVPTLKMHDNVSTEQIQILTMRHGNEFPDSISCWNDLGCHIYKLIRLEICCIAGLLKKTSVLL